MPKALALILVVLVALAVGFGVGFSITRLTRDPPAEVTREVEMRPGQPPFGKSWHEMPLPSVPEPSEPEHDARRRRGR